MIAAANARPNERPKGSSGPIWFSDAAPHAGQPYVAISYTGADNFGCGGSIGQQPVRTVKCKIDGTTVCVLHVPKGTVGKTLMVGFFLRGRSGLGYYIADGAPMRKLIRR
jgi:hypothetical protein